MKFIEELTSRFLTRKALPYWSVLFMDVVITVFAGIAAYAMNHGTMDMLMHFYRLIGTMFVYSLCYVVGF